MSYSNKKEPFIKKLGHYTRTNYNNAFLVVASSGISPTIMENHGAVLATIVRKGTRK